MGGLPSSNAPGVVRPQGPALTQVAGFGGSEPVDGKNAQSSTAPKDDKEVNDGNDGAADENMSGLISNDFQVQVGRLRLPLIGMLTMCRSSWQTSKPTPTPRFILSRRLSSFPCVSTLTALLTCG